MISRNFLFSLLLMAPSTLRGQSPSAEIKITRAIAMLNGVFSPRGFFNITVRLYQLAGVQMAKFDLKKSQMILDFQPGTTVGQRDVQRVVADAGYKPGPVEILLLSPHDVLETGPGWVKIKHPRSKNSLVRWFQLNF